MLKLETTEVPEEFKSLYEDAGNGVFRLKVEGAVSASEVEGNKTKLKEFRETNISLKKQLEDFSKLFGDGITPEKIQQKVEDLALQRAGEMKSSYEVKINELTESLTKTHTHLESVVLSDSVKAAALHNGVVDTALEDVLFRAKGSFQVVDGQLVAKEKNLDANGKPLNVDSWMKSLATSAPHLFAASKGTGAAKPARAESAPQMDTISRISAGLSKLKN